MRNLNLNSSSSLASQSVAMVAFEPVTFRDKCNSFDDVAVSAMVTQIDDAIAMRDNAPNNGGGSWSQSSRLIANNKTSLARFFLALDLRAENVICNQLVASALFNAKALKKIVELAKFAVTGSREIEKVMSAFIICALAFDAKNDGSAISNRINKSFLSNLDFSKIVTDTELADYLADYQHSFISGGKDTQSSQARRVLEVLRLGNVVNCENRSRGGVEINANHAFYSDFIAAFCN